MTSREVQHYIKLWKYHELHVEGLEEPSEDLFLVEFKSKHKTWKLYIEDECSYFKNSNQLVRIYLVLRALEDYKIEEDFLKWCNYYGIEVSESKWLEYYRDLDKIYAEIEQTLGNIDPVIPSMEFELQSGAFSELLRAEV